MAFQFVHLTAQFFADYAGCPEIEMKPDRPHLRVLVYSGSLCFAIPMRSHIAHPYAFMTDQANHCGLDYSKAVVITDEARYLIPSVKKIRQNEFNAMRGKERMITAGLERYIALYRKAKARPDIPRNQQLLRFSTLKYFEALLPG